MTVCLFYLHFFLFPSDIEHPQIQLLEELYQFILITGLLIALNPGLSRIDVYVFTDGTNVKV